MLRNQPVSAALNHRHTPQARPRPNAARFTLASQLTLSGRQSDAPAIPNDPNPIFRHFPSPVGGPNPLRTPYESPRLTTYVPPLPLLINQPFLAATSAPSIYQTNGDYVL